MRPACVLTVALLMLGGCGATTSLGPPPGSTAASTPASRTASASASPSGAGTAKPSDPGAIDVHTYASADFTNPDGSIRCSLTGQDASCDFPAGMDKARVPRQAKICPGAPLEVTGVTVSGFAEYFCSRGDDAHPQQKGSAAVWARTAGVPTVSVGGEVLVTLPEGRTLVHGKLSCHSADGAITCSHAQTKAAFTISAHGVKLTER